MPEAARSTSTRIPNVIRDFPNETEGKDIFRRPNTKSALSYVGSDFSFFFLGWIYNIKARKYQDSVGLKNDRFINFKNRRIGGIDMIEWFKERNQRGSERNVDEMNDDKWRPLNTRQGTFFVVLRMNTRRSWIFRLVK